MRIPAVLPLTALVSVAVALTPSDVQGAAFLSSMNGSAIKNLTGIVTAIRSNGFYLQSPTPSTDPRKSSAVFIFGSQAVNGIKVGQEVSLSGTVVEFQPSGADSSLHLTEIGSPHDIHVLSSGNKITPIVLGRDRTPPTEVISIPDPFILPGHTSSVEHDLDMDPSKNGLAFWESLEGMLVTIPNARAVTRLRSGQVWVVGQDYATSSNSRGGLTSGWNEQGHVDDQNPEALLVVQPLDGSRHPANIVIGSVVKDVTGVVDYDHGNYILRPLTALSAVSHPNGSAQPTKLTSDGCSSLTVASYNVENLDPRSDRMPLHGARIANHLRGPDIIALQEIQDNDGKTDSGETAADLTISTLIAAIKRAGGPTYEWTAIDPLDKQDGGQPGGNIRVVFLYRPDRVKLDSSEHIGDATTPQSIIRDPETGEVKLALNPGRIDPQNLAWDQSRKPLSASFTTLCKDTSLSKRLFAINVHLASKSSGSSPLKGDWLPALNGKVEQRIEQTNILKSFVQELLDADPNANIILLGDCNEFSHVKPLQILSEVLTEVAHEDPVERYSTVFDQNCQQLDHAFASPKLALQMEIEHIHVNNWVLQANSASDHDPLVTKINFHHESLVVQT